MLKLIRQTLQYSAVFLCLTASVASHASTVRVGLLAWLDTTEAESHWAPLMSHLQQKLPEHQIVAKHMNLAHMSDAIARGELDFVVTNPGHYVTLEAQHGITRIATQVAPRGSDPAHVVGAAVVVLAQRHDLQTLTDLKDRTLAAVSPDAFGGYQVVWAELKRQGLDPEKGRVRPLFTGFPMLWVLHAVDAGEADAGVIRGCLLEQMERLGQIPPGKYRVLSPKHANADCRLTSDTYPGWAFAATRGTPPALAREVLLALFSLPNSKDIDTWSVPADYHPVHAMLRELEIGPYAFLRETSGEALVRRYWPLVGILGGLLLIWLIYTLRVEHLVHRRTRELSAALQERERLETQMRTNQQQMDHLSRLSVLGELAGTLAHELNQPLAAIANYARSLTLRQSRGKLTPEALNQAADEIAHESERAASILAGIRAFARKRAHVRKACHPLQLAQASIDLFSGMLPHVPTLQLDNHLPNDVPGVWADARQIQQVLLNLLKNAYDAQGTVSLDAPITLRLQAVDGLCEIAVVDHGPGLDAALREQLFEPFFTTKAEGLGLGLSICKTIVEAHGGVLNAVPNQPGPGMTFRFTLPWQNTTDRDTERHEST